MAERFTLEKTSDENIASGNQPWRVGKSTITGFSQQLLWFQGFPSHGNDDTGGFFFIQPQELPQVREPRFFSGSGVKSLRGLDEFGCNRFGKPNNLPCGKLTVCY